MTEDIYRPFTRLLIFCSYNRLCEARLLLIDTDYCSYCAISFVSLAILKIIISEDYLLRTNNRVFFKMGLSFVSCPNKKVELLEKNEDFQ